jgi:ribonuclease HI
VDVKIECTYRTPKGIETRMYLDALPAEKAILLAEDLEKTGRVKNISFIDNLGNQWNTKEFKAHTKEIETEPHDITVYFDGGFDIDSKRSGLGYVIYYEQNGKSNRLRKNALVEELDTNNEAEYAALHLAVKELEEMGVHHLPVTFIGDSQVVINQLSGEWPCYEESLNAWANRIDEDLKRLGIHPRYQAVSRKNNREADQLATQALNNIDISAKRDSSD